KWLVSIIVTVLSIGVLGIVQRIQQIEFDNSCTNEYMVITLGVSTIVLFVIGLIYDRKDLPYIMRHGITWAVGAGTMNGLTNALGLFLYTLMPISIVSPIRSGTKIIMSFILSKLIFREKFEKRQAVGVLVGAAALVFLNL
nr:EamA family transporter [Clostridia bacterium]